MLNNDHGFTKCREDKTGKADISRVMLSGELIPPGHSSPHLLSVQKLAHEFVNAYTTLQAKIAALNTVTTEQLHETSRLKQELSLVCSNQHRNNSQEYHPSSGYSSMSPLKMSSGNPLSVRHSPATLDMRLSSQATQDIKQLHSDNSSSYPTKLSKLSPSRGRHSPRLLMEGNVRR
ncbi:hypothetical protein EB796_013864 [Bugula neritina]|uniref:Uncharacterized protein n=1 Tax=Bugula neritina TaxID=10212 RepID=A0A7J7JNA4_BUGNE|nr:hypothetical protein EB796_013864 [Bugula neritina]